MSGRRKGGVTLDRRLFSRTREVWNDLMDTAKGVSGGGRVFVDLHEVADALRLRFPEYARKPAGAFRNQVERELKRVEAEAAKLAPEQPAAAGAEAAAAADERPNKRQRTDAPELVQAADSNAMNMAMRGVHARAEAKAAEAEAAAAATSSSSSSAKKRRMDKKRKNRWAQPPAGGGDQQQGGGGAGDEGDAAGWEVQPTESHVRYADCGGIEAVLQDVRELIEWPLTHPEIFRHLKTRPTTGVLLHGPPGCGKTLLAHAIAGELEGVTFLKVSAPEIVSGVSGESEAKIRKLFEQAQRQAPCLVFVDEIDAIAAKRGSSSRGMDQRIVSQLGLYMEALASKPSDSAEGHVVVIGATNRPDSLDPSLRRAGRFDREIALGIPDDDARAHILEIMVGKMHVAGDFDYPAITRVTAGFVGSDIAHLCKEAATNAIRRIFSELPELAGGGKAEAAPAAAAAAAEEEDEAGAAADTDAEMTDASGTSKAASSSAASSRLRAHANPLSSEQLAPLTVEMRDFMDAVKRVQPSAKREGFATIPDVSWDDIGALEELREELAMSVLQPITNPKQFESIGIKMASGVLLFGPPGCGKTLVAKAIAKESGASFLSIKGPELLNQYVGASEQAVRQVFRRARASSPCVIFFDELDALAPKRGTGSDSGNFVSERVVNQLLTEMDGLDDRKRVFVIAATNRPDIIDPAMLRPGRLDKLLYVALPTAPERLAILEKHTRQSPLGPAVDLGAVASNPRAEGFSGADVAMLVREATLSALRRAQHEAMASDDPCRVLSVEVGPADFDAAFTKVQPSVSDKSRRRYDRLHRTLRNARSNVADEKKEPDAAAAAAASAAGEAAATEAAEPAAGPDAAAAPAVPAPAAQKAGPSARELAKTRTTIEELRLMLQLLEQRVESYGEAK